MNTVARLLLVVGAVTIAGVSAADPTASESVKPPAQPAAAIPAEPVTQSPAVAPVAAKAGKKVLVDDTVTDAQLKRILRMGYKPENQARGNEVYYCRSERQLGTRFETKACKTAAHIFQVEQGGKEATSYVERIGAASEGTKK